MLSAEIVAGHDADGFGEAADPFGEFVGFLVIAAGAFAGTGEDGAGVTGGTEGIDEMFFAPLGPVETIVAGVSKIAEAAFE